MNRTEEAKLIAKDTFFRIGRDPNWTAEFDSPFESSKEKARRILKSIGKTEPEDEHDGDLDSEERARDALKSIGGR